MDPGNFLTDSGSKIPISKSSAPSLRVPQKPNLAASTVKNTNFVNAVQAKTATSSLVKTRTGIGRSIPNVSNTKPLVRSKTNLSKAAAATLSSKVVSTTQAVKRQASNDDGESSSAKIPKTGGGFPYKAKNWELKLRLQECEEWLTEARSRITDLEEESDRNANDLNMLSDIKLKLQRECTRANNSEERLSEKTAAYDKLHTDSKQFLETIQGLEQDKSRKTLEIEHLQTDLAKVKEELLTKTSDLSKLQFAFDDLEFKFRRQKNSLDDLDNLYTDSKKECSTLQSKVREHLAELGATQDRLERVERELKCKISINADLEQELVQAKNKINELERNLASSKSSNSGLASDISGLRDELASEKMKVAEMTTQNEQFLAKLSDAEKLRRVLHNQVQDLKGNIRVFCRVRPALSNEKENCLMCSINYPDEGTIEVAKADPFESGNNQITSRPKFQKHEFNFDRVFNPTATQGAIFEELSQLVQSALDGYNVCIFAYGQTGSGKTYTMEGPSNSEGRGMIPRTVQHIFETVADLERIGWEYTVEVCFIEIYNEVIRDLLRSDKEGSNLKIMQVDSRTNDVVIPGLTVMKVGCFEDLDRLYVLAHQNRAVASTNYNERSSRSHSVTKIKVTGVNKDRGETCHGSLNLVDLAGSERLNESTHASENRLREMKAINKSLTELGNVILGLYQKNEHIPYRNSKLTHLLQPALGGSSKTLMLVNISPIDSNMSETLCSLRFAQKVNQVKVVSSKKRITYDPASAVPTK